MLRLAVASPRSVRSLDGRPIPASHPATSPTTRMIAMPTKTQVPMAPITSRQVSMSALPMPRRRPMLDAWPALPTQSSASAGYRARTMSPRPSGMSMNRMSDWAMLPGVDRRSRHRQRHDDGRIGDRDHHQQDHRTDREGQVRFRQLGELGQEGRSGDTADEHDRGRRRVLHGQQARGGDGSGGDHHEVDDEQRDDQPHVAQRLGDPGDGQAETHGGHAADHEHEHGDLGDDFQRLGEHVHSLLGGESPNSGLRLGALSSGLCRRQRPAGRMT